MPNQTALLGKAQVWRVKTKLILLRYPGSLDNRHMPLAIFSPTIYFTMNRNQSADGDRSSRGVSA